MEPFEWWKSTPTVISTTRVVGGDDVGKEDGQVV
jgi:hypothetical protein